MFYFGYLISSTNIAQDKVDNYSVLQDTIIISDSSTFSKEELKKYIKFLNLKHPDIVYAQAVLETGNFKSNIFINNNNLFGMRVPGVRSNTVRGKVNNYAYYKNWKESVVDYALYQASYLRKLDRNQYFNYLDANYAKDVNYSLKLKQVIKENKL